MIINQKAIGRVMECVCINLRMKKIASPLLTLHNNNSNICSTSVVVGGDGGGGGRTSFSFYDRSSFFFLLFSTLGRSGSCFLFVTSIFCLIIFQLIEALTRKAQLFERRTYRIWPLFFVAWKWICTSSEYWPITCVNLTSLFSKLVSMSRTFYLWSTKWK